MVTKEITTLSITNSDQDLLGRENIVTAITNKIVERSKSNIHCEVIGVYSKWGEGKTSVLNLVKEQLKIQKGDKKHEIRCVDFNPWLFKDQESLLLDFFKVLQKGATNNDVKEKLKHYGPLVALGARGLINIIAPGIGAMAGCAIKEVIKSISDVELDVLSLKREIDDQIKLANEHYLIFIDDVDRLDIDELHALFKLIRQNADFVNTTYIIAMDVDMVAKSIGNWFESGCMEAGKNFLEKIVQYPVHLPKVEDSKMEDVFEKLIISEFRKLYDNNPTRTMQPFDELEANLKEYVLPLFDTVREMILYRNAVSFILPSLHTELNITDFAMLEGLKHFHKKGYDKIKGIKYMLIDIDETGFDPNTELVIKFLQSIHKDITPEKRFAIESILFFLTASLKSNVYYKGMEGDRSKKLLDVEYFDNYFEFPVEVN